jgi:predicted DNA-binding transcriptional regulator AlpA
MAAPEGTMVPAAMLARALAAVPTADSTPHQAGPKREAAATWRERLWTVDPATRIGVAELCEALGRSKSWVWRHTGKRCPGVRIPHRKLEGELVFVVGEVRSWIAQNESVIVPGWTTPLEIHRRRAS